MISRILYQIILWLKIRESNLTGTENALLRRRNKDQTFFLSFFSTKDTDSPSGVLGREELDGAVSLGAAILHLDLGKLHFATVVEFLFQVLPREREWQLQKKADHICFMIGY